MSVWTSLDKMEVDDEDVNMSDKISELTALSDTEEDDARLPRPPFHMEAYEKLSGISAQFEQTIRHFKEPVDSDLLDCLRQIKERIRSIETNRYTIAVVGWTGGGKSTLNCALLKAMVLPSDSVCAKPCTATITEISYHQHAEFKAVVKFVTRDQWKDVLLLLKGDLSVQMITDDTDVSAASPASRARARFIEVYPRLRNEAFENWSIDRLLDESPIRELLGSSKEIIDADPNKFQLKLKACITSCGVKSDEPALWPLVSTVHIFGQFEVLQNGITLVDLPGHGDANSERNQLAEVYLKRADYILLVTKITRAKDNREDEIYLRKLFTQLSVDGRARDNSVGLVVTHSDTLMGDNQCPLTDTESAEVAKYCTEIIGLRERAKKATDDGVKSEKKLKNGHCDAATKEKIRANLKKLHNNTAVYAEKNREINQMKNLILAGARSRYVRTNLQETYSRIQNELSNAPKTTFPIFCVGSSDYLGCLQLQTNPPVVFQHNSETGIPQLQQFIASLGEKDGLTNIRLAIRDTQDFVSQIKASFVMPEKHNPDVEKYKDKAVGVITSLGMRAEARNKDAVRDIRREFDAVAEDVDRQAKKVREESGNVFMIYGSKESKTRWNTYRACMRRDGVWGPVDLNHRLTANIFAGVMARWNKTVNIAGPLHISRLVEDLIDDYDSTLQDIGANAPNSLVENLKVYRSIHIKSRLDHLSHSIQSMMDATQRKGSRAPKEVMQRNLHAHYQDVGQQTGIGLFDKMKDMNVEYMLEHGDELYDAVAKDIRDMFDNLASEIEAKIAGKLIKINKLLLSLLGRISGAQQIVDPDQLQRIVSLVETAPVSIRVLLDSVEERLESL